ncbi:RBBP9/YdeN family alpha/beta hydrolase [Chitinolyticbacter meiyuanensis]|uniref:RBBP9/YdeN family alpha/beta hydrolase n=1 Tax=Chitinolyticbacter meiyuanensis TaxID=682798 RepID=UPI0011E5EFED|nr:alpha/beta fold hydrolase [Chitinolyticbacter meiyuanensis]
MIVLTVPGIGGSGPEHWQSRWEALHADTHRVEQADWGKPWLADWLSRLDAAVANAGPDCVLVAHSLGCLLVAHWAAGYPQPIRGALLVAVPDPAAPAFPTEAAEFTLPQQALPFPALMVASRDDPYADFAFSERAARVWGAELVDAGARGHLNAASGLAAWPEGWALLERWSSDA